MHFIYTFNNSFWPKSFNSTCWVSEEWFLLSPAVISLALARGHALMMSVTANWHLKTTSQTITESLSKAHTFCDVIWFPVPWDLSTRPPVIPLSSKYSPVIDLRIPRAGHTKSTDESNHDGVCGERTSPGRYRDKKRRSKKGGEEEDESCLIWTPFNRSGGGMLLK